MKTWLYIAIGVLLLSVVLLATCKRQPPTEIDKRITLHKDFQTPYGTSAMYQMLARYFPSSDIKLQRSDLYYDSTTHAAGGKQLMFIIGRRFHPTIHQLNALTEFVEEGNILFVSAASYSRDALDLLEVEHEKGSSLEMMDMGYPFDSVHVALNEYLAKDASFFNPGNSFPAYFMPMQQSGFTSLGSTGNGLVNFGRIEMGEGLFYAHTDPFLFANYFLLYKQNHRYLDHIMAAMPKAIHTVYWDDYLRYNSGGQGEKSPLRFLFSIAAFKAAFILALVLLALYVLLNAKRMRPPIPVYERPRNESLDFVKTIGRLYFQQGDHSDLGRKMVHHLYDHIRSRYQLSTAQADDAFVEKLSLKSGYDLQKVQQLISTAVNLQKEQHLSEEQLGQVYFIFKRFYKHHS